MARSLKKGPYVDPKLVKKIDKINEAGKKNKKSNEFIIKRRK